MPSGSNLIRGGVGGREDLRDGCPMQRDEQSRAQSHAYREAAKHKAGVSGGQKYCKGRGRSQYGKKQHLFMEVEGKGETN